MIAVAERTIFNIHASLSSSMRRRKKKKRRNSSNRRILLNTGEKGWWWWFLRENIYNIIRTDPESEKRCLATISKKEERKIILH
uniref:Uncharacterized protein n=1 Tax=Octopus bimaculoides TaxID=37653 RepID=A0A0L8H8K9_OCTBM